MSRVKSRHPEDFALLCFTAGDADEAEKARISGHLDECPRCLMTFTELRRVHTDLRRHFSGGRSSSPTEGRDLSPGDPFRERPARSERLDPRARETAAIAVDASQRAQAEVEALIEAGAGAPAVLRRYLERLSLSDPAARFLLLFGFDEAAQRIPDAPGRFLRLGEMVLVRLAEEETRGGTDDSDAERVVPFSTVVGQAHVLAGLAANWTGELDRARRHFEDAYAVFRWETDGDEVRIALTEFGESQRRSFAGSPAEGVILARRARATFERFGLDDFVARARVAEGIGVSLLGRDEEALACFRGATPVFEGYGLWRNFVAVVNSIAFSLARLGRLEEARREYSRALRLVSRERDRSLLAFARNGLAHLLFFAKRYADAAKSFLQASGLFQQLDQIGDALTASLWEIESWARSGDFARARHRLEIFRTVVGRTEALDPFIVRSLELALGGLDPDLEAIAELRRRAESALRENLESRAG